MRNLVLASLLALAACGGKSTPPPAAPTGDSPAQTDPAAACNLEGPDHTPATAEQCECAGFTVVGDIGDGQVKCPDGSTEVSKIRYGIEGGVCCDSGQPDQSTAS